MMSLTTVLILEGGIYKVSIIVAMEDEAIPVAKALGLGSHISDAKALSSLTPPVSNSVCLLCSFHVIRTGPGTPASCSVLQRSI